MSTEAQENLYRKSVKKMYLKEKENVMGAEEI